ncbi:MAG: hypothetical protein H7242_00870, partial [Microbacteriaceae bacterium]|nr:hypothetical protein [Burkholderiaceae bacterium]
MPRHTPPAEPGQPAPANRRASPVADTRGGLRLVVAGSRHITGLVEALHGQIQRLAPPLRGGDAEGESGRADNSDGLPATRGLTGLVYRSIQGSLRLVGDGLGGLLAPFDSALQAGAPSP